MAAKDGDRNGWLVLTRRVHEEIVLVVCGVEVRVSVAAAKDGRASLAVKAPLGVQVYRGELLEARERTVGRDDCD